MKNILLILLMMIIPLQKAFSESGRSQKIELERIFEDRLRHFFPENKFSISLEMKKEEIVDVGFFGDVKLPTDNDAVNQIAAIVIHTDSNITPQFVNEILGTGNVQVTISKVTLPAPAQTKTQNNSSVQDSSRLNWWLGAVGFSVVAFFIGIYFVNRSIRSLPAPIASALSQNGNSSGSSATQAATAQVHTKMDSTFKPRAEQLKAYLSDCYWCFEDGKAAAFLREYQEIQTFSELSFGAEYVNYLTSVEPEATDFWEDSFYLAPSSELSEVCVEDMASTDFLRCSRMRLQKCTLSAYELTKLKMTNENVPAIPKFAKSAHRKLVSPLVFNFATDHEEAEFLGSDLPEYVKFSAPSLYLLSKLENETFMEITQSFNVKELAEAWIGPDFILQNIMSKLPERKQQLLSEVLESRKDRRESDKASKRQSPVFKRLVKATQVKGSHMIADRSEKIRLVG